MYQDLLQRGKTHDPREYTETLKAINLGKEISYRICAGKYQIGLRRIPGQETVIHPRLKKIIDNPSREDLDFLYEIIRIT